jgi:hypothetical protein
MNLWEIGYDERWLELAQDRVQPRTLVLAVVELKGSAITRLVIGLLNLTIGKQYTVFGMGSREVCTGVTAAKCISYCKIRSCKPIVSTDKSFK